MKHKDIILLLASTFFLVVAWITFNIYHSSVESTTPEVLKKEILPIKPNFDETTINKLKERKRISPIYDFVPQSTPPAEIIISPEITKEPQGSASALIASPAGEVVQ